MLWVSSCLSLLLLVRPVLSYSRQKVSYHAHESKHQRLAWLLTPTVRPFVKFRVAPASLISLAAIHQITSFSLSTPDRAELSIHSWTVSGKLQNSTSLRNCFQMTVLTVSWYWASTFFWTFYRLFEVIGISAQRFKTVLLVQRITPVGRGPLSFSLLLYN